MIFHVCTIAQNPKYRIENHLFSEIAFNDQMYSNLEVNPWQSDPGKEVVQDNGKQLSMNNGEIEPVAIEPVGIELVEKQNIFARDNLRQRLKWREIALILAFGSMIILAIVGGVIASQKRHSTQSWVPNVNVPQLRNIAALSFASNSINMTRVYFQDDEGQIVEAANSHVANDSGWNMAVLGFGAKNWSALAAAVSRPGFPLVSPFSHVLECVLMFLGD